MDLREELMQAVGGQDCPDAISDAALEVFERWLRGHKTCTEVRGVVIYAIPSVLADELAAMSKPGAPPQYDEHGRRIIPRGYVPGPDHDCDRAGCSSVACVPEKPASLAGGQSK